MDLTHRGRNAAVAQGMRDQRIHDTRERARATGRLAQMVGKNTKLLRDSNALRDQCSQLRHELADERAARRDEVSRLEDEAKQQDEMVISFRAELRKVYGEQDKQAEIIKALRAEHSEIFDDNFAEFRRQLAENQRLAREVQELREAVMEGLNRTIYVVERCWQEGADAGLLLMTRFSEMVVLCDRPLVADQHFMLAVQGARAANVAAGRQDLQRI